MRSVSLEFSTNNNYSIKQLFKVLSLVNTRPQPWVPLIDGLVNDAVFQLSPDGDEVLHCKPFYSVLPSYGNNAYQVYGPKCLFR